jgi:hypothetical protein
MQRTINGGVPNSDRYEYNTTPIPKAQRISKKREHRGFKRQRGQDVCCQIVSSVYDKEATPMRSQNCGHLNTVTIPVSLAAFSITEISHGLPIDEELTVN